MTNRNVMAKTCPWKKKTFAPSGGQQKLKCCMLTSLLKRMLTSPVTHRPKLADATKIGNVKTTIAPEIQQWQTRRMR